MEERKQMREANNIWIITGVLFGLSISCLAVPLIGWAPHRVSAIESRVKALEEKAARRDADDIAKRKVGQLIVEMDAKVAAQCKHEGPYFIAEGGQGTYCLDCGAKIKD